MEAACRLDPIGCDCTMVGRLKIQAMVLADMLKKKATGRGGSRGRIAISRSWSSTCEPQLLRSTQRDVSEGCARLSRGSRRAERQAFAGGWSGLLGRAFPYDAGVYSAWHVLSSVVAQHVAGRSSGKVSPLHAPCGGPICVACAQQAELACRGHVRETHLNVLLTCPLTNPIKLININHVPKRDGTLCS